MREIRNARITSAFLGYEDHRILTIMIGTSSGATGQSFGGYALDRYDEDSKKRVGHKICADWIIKILEVLEVSSWCEIKGKYCRVDADSSRIYGIGNIIEDKWFYPEEA